MFMAKKQDDIQSAITRRDTDTRPTIERGSYGDRGDLEANRPDGVGKSSNEVDSTTPQFYAQVAVDRGSPLTAHAVEIAGMLGSTAVYGGHGFTHPSTGSPIPNADPDENYYRQTGADQQRGDKKG
jgi:hypothetical protein